MSNAGIESRISNFVHEQATQDAPKLERSKQPFWSGLGSQGTELWLDTGDMNAAAELWSGDFTALTTNNSLLNKEIQKGIYDDLVRRAQPLVDVLPEDEQVMEISFILNAVHGLRLVDYFGARVSVELHTQLAHDIDRSVNYGKRFAAICSDFVVKIPLTASGLIATRHLRQSGIPINFTLGFGARQNAIATLFAEPDYVNVFLGRLNAYAESNRLSGADYLGERATWASQEFLRQQNSPTRQIAASIRDAKQLERLAGVDVFTIPVKIARDALATLDGRWTGSMAGGDNKFVANQVVAKACSVSDLDVKFAHSLCESPPHTGEELVDRAHENGVGDMFPRMTVNQLETIAADGKIPVHKKWAECMAQGELALDSLLNLAGLASFSQDQQALDDRVRSLLSP